MESFLNYLQWCLLVVIDKVFKEAVRLPVMCTRYTSEWCTTFLDKSLEDFIELGCDHSS